MKKYFFLIVATITILMISSILIIKSSMIFPFMTFFYDLTYDSEENDGIVFNYHESDNEIYEELKSTLTEVSLLGSDWFKVKNENKLTVYVAQEGSLLNSLLFNRKAIYVPTTKTIVINGENTRSELKHALAHEYAHDRLMELIDSYDLGSEKFPVWFHEGIAEAFAHRISPLPFNNNVNKWDVIPVENMFQSNTHKNISEWYVMSHFIIEDIIRKNGINFINKLVSLTSQNNDFKTSFYSITGKRLAELHHILKVDNKLIDDSLLRSNEQEEWEALKKDLTHYIEEMPPYFYRAEEIYYILEQIYSKEKNWRKALNMIENRMNYIDSSALWRKAAEYALLLEDKNKVEDYLKRDNEVKKNGGSMEGLLENIENN